MKTSAEAREMVGYNAGKRIKGRKRHLVTDTLRPNMLRIEGQSAGVQDHGAALVLNRGRFPFLERIFADAGYQGPRVGTGRSHMDAAASVRVIAAARGWLGTP